MVTGPGHSERSYHPGQVWPWESGPSRPGSRLLGQILSAGLYVVLTVACVGALGDFHHRTLCRDARRMESLVVTVAGGLRPVAARRPPLEVAFAR